MGDWKEVNRCTECGKIYECGIPRICKKCGVVLGTNDSFMRLLFGKNLLIRTNKCEKVIARRRFFGWQIRKTATYENISGSHTT